MDWDFLWDGFRDVLFFGWMLGKFCEAMMFLSRSWSFLEMMAGSLDNIVAEILLL